MSKWQEVTIALLCVEICKQFLSLVHRYTVFMSCLCLWLRRLGIIYKGFTKVILKTQRAIVSVGQILGLPIDLRIFLA